MFYQINRLSVDLLDHIEDAFTGIFTLLTALKLILLRQVSA